MSVRGKKIPVGHFIFVVDNFEHNDIEHHGKVYEVIENKLHPHYTHVKVPNGTGNGVNKSRNTLYIPDECIIEFTGNLDNGKDAANLVRLLSL